MSKHTPGPWRVFAPQDEYVFVETSDNARPKWVCCISDPRHDMRKEMSVALANARLIAAAPDLLHALKEIVEFWDSVVPDECTNEQHAKARAAIAKAEGGGHA